MSGYHNLKTSIGKVYDEKVVINNTVFDFEDLISVELVKKVDKNANIIFIISGLVLFLIAPFIYDHTGLFALTISTAVLFLAGYFLYKKKRYILKIVLKVNNEVIIYPINKSMKEEAKKLVVESARKLKKKKYH